MRLILNRDVVVAGERLPAGTDVTKLDKDYLSSILAQGWASQRDDEPQGESESSEPTIEETEPAKPQAKPTQSKKKK